MRERVFHSWRASWQEEEKVNLQSRKVKLLVIVTVYSSRRKRSEALTEEKRR